MSKAWRQKRAVVVREGASEPEDVRRAKKYPPQPPDGDSLDAEPLRERTGQRRNGWRTEVVGVDRADAQQRFSCAIDIILAAQSRFDD